MIRGELCPLFLHSFRFFFLIFIFNIDDSTSIIKELWIDKHTLFKFPPKEGVWISFVNDY